MESKLKTLVSLKKFDYNGYKKLLKDSLKDLVNQTGIIEYVLVDGIKIPWKNASDQDKAVQPLLYLGSSSLWQRDLKADKDIQFVHYSYGSCKVVQVGKDVHLYLVPTKGKATEAKYLKPIQKELKKLKPKVFLELVADLNEVEDSAVEVHLDENSSLGEEFQELGRELRKYHDLSTKIKEKVKTADAAEKSKLQIKYKQVLNRLKNLCMNWTEDVLPQEATLVQGKEAETWAKIYQKWNAYFEKRQAAKEGKSDDKEGRQLEEERLYTKTLEDLDQFFTAVEHSEDLDPSVIEMDLSNLKNHVESWKAFVAGKESHYEEELKAVEEQMQSLEVEWAAYEPLLKRYHKANAALKAAQDANDTGRIARLKKGVEKALAQIK